MPLTTDTKKVMFEIYRDSDFGGKFKVVYFTELGEHDKETEIENAMRGQHIFDGFLLHRERNQAKVVVDEILERSEPRRTGRRNGHPREPPTLPCLVAAHPTH